MLTTNVCGNLVVAAASPPLCLCCFQFGKCVACPPSAGASAGALAGISLLLIVLCLGVYRIRHLLPVDVFKLGLSMVQVCVFDEQLAGIKMLRWCGSSNARPVGCRSQILSSGSGVYDIPWPQSFMAFISTLRVFLIDVVSITKGAPNGAPLSLSATPTSTKSTSASFR